MSESIRRVELTVNGAPVAIDVPTRRLLSDALRVDLGLTGTHLGCEHGVCGMCTVLVDGEAARACLGDVALVAREPVAFDDPADTGPFQLVSRHGSLTSAEMLVPLLVTAR